MEPLFTRKRQLGLVTKLLQLSFEPVMFCCMEPADMAVFRGGRAVLVVYINGTVLYGLAWA